MEDTTILLKTCQAFQVHNGFQVDINRVAAPEILFPLSI